MKRRSDRTIRNALLEEAQRQGRVQFRRVGSSAIERVRRREVEAHEKIEREIEQLRLQAEGAYDRIIQGEVQHHPSKGVTIL